MAEQPNSGESVKIELRRFFARERSPTYSTLIAEVYLDRLAAAAE